MKDFRIPPREKIHEALSAIADNRVRIEGNTAIVTSSDNSKSYNLEWQDNIYISNDNGSYYVGYIGYPIVAVLMFTDKLSYNRDYVSYFKGINWKALNTKVKNDYPKAVEEFYNDLRSQGIDVDIIDQEITRIYEELKTLDIDSKRSKIMPPR